MLSIKLIPRHLRNNFNMFIELIQWGFITNVDTKPSELQRRKQPILSDFLDSTASFQSSTCSQGLVQSLQCVDPHTSVHSFFKDWMLPFNHAQARITDSLLAIEEYIVLDDQPIRKT